MRIILFAIAFLSSFCCFSQVNEDFSDGDFTQNPEWSGTVDKFMVDSKKALKLNDTSGESGYANLFTKSSALRGTTWEFYIHLLFNPSINNYGLFYLALSEPGLTETSDGYFLMIGGDADCVSLCRIDHGVYETLLVGRLLMKNINSPRLKIKVQCDKDGNWTLQTCLLNGENDYTIEGTVKDIHYITSSYIGVGCAYTASRNKSFIFDDIHVSADGDIPAEPDHPDRPIPGDTIPPGILSLQAISDTVIRIRYNEAVNIEKANFYVNANHKIKKKSLSKDKQKLDVLLLTPLENNQPYMMTMNGVKDLSGNMMPVCSVSFIYYDTSMQTATFADVVFNEIMADPKGIIAYPESEYIELFNRKDVPVNLKGWKLYYGDKPYVLPETLLLPGNFAVICDEKFRIKWGDCGIEVVGLPSFPSLSNSGKLLYLEDSRERLISWVNYSDSWYKDDFKKKGGFSLECVDTDNLSGDSENWEATIDKKGGTPGRENSVKSALPDNADAEVSYYYLQAPDTLIICFTKSMDFQALSEVGFYRLNNTEKTVVAAKPTFPECKSVALVLSSVLAMEEELEVELSGLKDISGREIKSPFLCKIALSQVPVEGDLFFNELLFNPFPGEDDYVELYNTSEKYIALNQLRFSSLKKDGSYSEAIPLTSDKRVFCPGTYLCFTKEPEILCNRYACCRNGLVWTTALPSLPDDKGTILLLTQGKELLDRFDYTEKMHSALLDNKEGIALEKIFPALNSRAPSNWLSASSASEGGTPGCRNSQYREFVADSNEGFYLENESFSPDGDGLNDELIIAYHLSGENYQASLKAFDLSGRLIHSIAENSRLEQSGCFVWTGKDRNDRLFPVGLYIIYVEVYNPQGEMKHFKLACALTM